METLCDFPRNTQCNDGTINNDAWCKAASVPRSARLDSCMSTVIRCSGGASRIMKRLRAFCSWVGRCHDGEEDREVSGAQMSGLYKRTLRLAWCLTRGRGGRADGGRNGMLAACISARQGWFRPRRSLRRSYGKPLRLPRLAKENG